MKPSCLASLILSLPLIVGAGPELAPTSQPAQQRTAAAPSGDRASFLPYESLASITMSANAVKAELEGRDGFSAELAEIGLRVRVDHTSAVLWAPVVQTAVFVDGADSASAAFDSFITAAEIEARDLQTNDPLATTLGDLLLPIHGLLQDNDNWGPTPRWILDERLLKVLKGLHQLGSARSQLINYAYAENLLMQQRLDDALAAFNAVVAERKMATEPSEGINRSVDWEIGLCLLYAKRPAEAAEHFRAMTEDKGVPEGARSWVMAIASYARSGQVAKANLMLDEWIRQRKPTATEILPALFEIEHASEGVVRPGNTAGLPTPAELPTGRARVALLRQQIAANPRSAATALFKDRSLDALAPLAAHEDAAELALQCLNAQADRTDRVEYFLMLRTRALLAAGKTDQALAAARSFYNVCLVKDTPRAIELLAECLSNAHAKDPAMVRRFKLQQLAGAQPVPSHEIAGVDLGADVLADIKIDETFYDGKGLQSERNAQWRQLGAANLMLMRGRSDEAQMIFELLSRSATETIATAGREGVARALKTKNTRLSEANFYLSSLVSVQ